MSLKEIFDAIVNYQIPFEGIGVFIAGIFGVLIFLALLNWLINRLKDFVDGAGTLIARFYWMIRNWTKRRGKD